MTKEVIIMEIPVDDMQYLICAVQAGCEHIKQKCYHTTLSIFEHRVQEVGQNLLEGLRREYMKELKQ